MAIEGLKRYQGRNPDGYFADLTPSQRWAAYQWLSKFCARWGRNLPQWRRAILIGQARRLALNPPTRKWGRSMLAKRGGHEVQRQYREQGRVGRRHPAHHAAEVSASKRRWRKRKQEEEKRRAELGLGPKPRVAYLSLYL
jgi:hypothetical protein